MSLFKTVLEKTKGTLEETLDWVTKKINAIEEKSLPNEKSSNKTLPEKKEVAQKLHEIEQIVQKGLNSVEKTLNLADDPMQEQVENWANLTIQIRRKEQQSSELTADKTPSPAENTQPSLPPSELPATTPPQTSQPLEKSQEQSKATYDYNLIPAEFRLPSYYYEYHERPNSPEDEESLEPITARRPAVENAQPLSQAPSPIPPISQPLPPTFASAPVTEKIQQLLSQSKASQAPSPIPPIQQSVKNVQPEKMVEPQQINAETAKKRKRKEKNSLIAEEKTQFIEKEPITTTVVVVEVDPKTDIENFQLTTIMAGDKPKTRRNRRSKQKQSDLQVEISDDDLFAETERIEKELRIKGKKYDDSTWEQARAMRQARLAIIKKSTQELKQRLDERCSEITENNLGDFANDQEYRLIRMELARRERCEKEVKEGFTYVGDETAVIPIFATHLIGVSRGTRKSEEGIKGRNFLKNKQLFYKERERQTKSGQMTLKTKQFQSIEYLGYEISVDDWFTFLAVIKCAINHQKMGKDPFGILVCKKSDIIKFVGWDERGGGRTYRKVIECLKVLTSGTLTIEQGNDIFAGHLIDGFYTSKADFEWKTQTKAPESLQDLRRGEIYLRISPFLMPFFNNRFFKIDMRPARLFHGSGQANDLKVWFYFYLMSLYYVEEKRIIPATRNNPQRTEIVPKFQEIINLEDIKRISRFSGSVKRLKILLSRFVLPEMAEHFLANEGVLAVEWDKKDPYKMILKKFKKPNIYDYKEKLQGRDLIKADVIEENIRRKQNNAPLLPSFAKANQQTDGTHQDVVTQKTQDYEKKEKKENEENRRAIANLLGNVFAGYDGYFQYKQNEARMEALKRQQELQKKNN